MKSTACQMNKRVCQYYVKDIKTFKFKNAILEIAFWAKPI